MILFLFGSDTYRLQEKLKEIVEEYKKGHRSGLNFIKINFKEKDFADFKQAIETVSMFDEKKLIIIEGAFQQPKNFQEKLLDYLKKRKVDSREDIIVIFWTEKIESKNKLFEFLKKKGRFQKFEPLKKYQLKSWIKKFTREKGGEIEDQAVEKLINYVGNDLWRISNELEKLIAFEKRIRVENVENLVTPEIDINIFNIIDSLGQKNKKRALKLVHDYFKKGEDEGYLLNRFIYQFRNLIKVKSGGGKDLHPFVFKKTNKQAKNFSFEELKKIYQKLLDIDLGIKTGKFDVKTALELFVTSL